MYFVIGLAYLMLSSPVTVQICLSVGMRESSACLYLTYLGVRLKCRLFHRQWRTENVVRLFSRRKKEESGFLRQMRRIRTYAKILNEAGRFHRLDLHLRLGFHDAAQTALAAGACRAAVFSAAAYMPRALCEDIKVQADHDAAGFLLYVRGIFSAAAGDIILAAVRAACKSKRREGTGWKSIPLKA